MNTLGAKVRKLREERGWAVRLLARRAGLSHTYIEKIEDGDYKRGPGMQAIERIAKALDVEAAYFFDSHVI